MTEKGYVRVYNPDTGRGVIISESNADDKGLVTVDFASLQNGVSLLQPGQRVRFGRRAADPGSCEWVTLDSNVEKD